MLRQIKIFATLMLLSSGGMVLGGRLASTALAGSQDYYSALDVFSQVLHRVRQDYVEEVDSDKLIQGAINGMIRTLDPYSQYMSPTQYQQFQEETSGDYYGIGVEISQEKNGLRVVAPYPGSPAERAGLQAGDLIVSVEGATITELGAAEAISRIKGRKGTLVTLGVLRGSTDKPKDFKVERDQIHTPAVVSAALDNGIAYVKLIQFQERVATETLDAIRTREKELGKAGLKGVVMDLRNNPGGLLDEAVKLSDMFLETGVIVKTEGRHEDPEIERARRGGPFEQVPLVVLVDEGSASASEIVAGALQDHKRAMVVGERSYGKGSVQNIIRLDNGGALRLTVARYFTPSGRPIDPKNSIVPDVEVAMDDAASAGVDESDNGMPSLRKFTPNLKQDAQLREALEVLKNPNKGRHAGGKTTSG